MRAHDQVECGLMHRSDGVARAPARRLAPATPVPATVRRLAVATWMSSSAASPLTLRAGGPPTLRGRPRPRLARRGAARPSTSPPARSCRAASSLPSAGRPAVSAATGCTARGSPARPRLQGGPTCRIARPWYQRAVERRLGHHKLNAAARLMHTSSGSAPRLLRRTSPPRRPDSPPTTRF